MDNRIPPVFTKFVNTHNQSDIDFLCFTDWISKKENEANDWIVVAKIDRKDVNNSIFTHSCFANPANNKTKNNIFKEATWGINVEFGKPYIEENYDGKRKFVIDNIYKIDGYTLRPFVIRRHIGGSIKSKYEFLQPFIFYYNAFWVEEKKEYHLLDEEGDIKILAKMKYFSESNEEILVDSSYLRTYLNLTNSYLIRFHDHIRCIKKKLNIKFETGIYENDLYYYELDLRTDIPSAQNETFSRLLGKDIVLPFKKEKPKQEKEYISFIIGQDENGKAIECTCHGDSLSNYFTDKQTPHMLTAVFFDKKVLSKYYSEPTKYEILGLTITCIGLWYLDYDITDENLVQVWLSDLGNLSYKEQTHWRQFNVLPKGTITEHRWKRDFMVEYALPTIEQNPIIYFHEIYDEINDVSTKSLGNKLFKPLQEGDMYLLRILRIPLTQEWKEFDEQIQSLAKILCDSINVELLTKITGKKIDKDTEIKGSIHLLKEFLKQKEVSEETINSMIELLTMIQSLRSAGAAHRKGDNFNKELKKYNLLKLSNDDKIKKILVDTCQVMKSLVSILENYNAH